ncbi:MAG: ARMT1-like domain-containing protein [Fibrobacterota bacterium]
MKSFHDCLPCFVNQALEAVRQISDDEGVHERVLRKVLRLASSIDMSDTPPAMAQKIHRIIRKETGAADPYRRKKEHYNRWAEAALPALADAAKNQDDPFENCLRLAIAGNIIDFGKNGRLNEADVRRVIEGCYDAPLDIRAVRRLKREVSAARDILYLGDNAGEIVFDRYFMRLLPVNRVTFVVRGKPVINDVTRADAEAVRMPLLVKVIDNGSDAPGTVLSDCSAEFRDSFDRADLIIAKGQGNYETLSNVDKNIYFLLQAKCPVVARDLKCCIGDYIVRKRSQQHAKR